MISQSGFIGFQEQKIHCIKMGQGQELLLAFHGFDNDAGLFAPLAEYLQEKYTLVALDLPGHGKTEWSEKYLKIDALMALVQGLKNDFKVDKLSLLGFSLGGRVCLNIVQQQPDWINSLYLIAPDGLTKNIWYRLATRNLLGKQIFKQLTRQPQLWIKRLSWLKKFRLVDDSRFKFAKKMLVDRDMSQRVGSIWPLMSRLIPNIAQVKWNINKHQIFTKLMLGRYDRIIPLAAGKAFVKNLESNASLHVLEQGHDLLNPGQVEELAQIINS